MRLTTTKTQVQNAPHTSMRTPYARGIAVCCIIMHQRTCERTGPHVSHAPSPAPSPQASTRASLVPAGLLHPLCTVVHNARHPSPRPPILCIGSPIARKRTCGASAALVRSFALGVVPYVRHVDSGLKHVPTPMARACILILMRAQRHDGEPLASSRSL